MDYSAIKVPYISKAVIKINADKFRMKFWGDLIPVDIEKIIDVKLGIDIIPTPGMMRLCNTDALISSDWKSINVDEGWYEDERNLNRLRYSLAHELGHFVLHKSLYASFGIREFEDFYKFINEIPNQEYSKLEWQAQQFASYLLVPREKVWPLYDTQYKKFRELTAADFFNIEEEQINQYIAIPMSKKFEVSQEVMFYVLCEVTK